MSTYTLFGHTIHLHEGGESAGPHMSLNGADGIHTHKGLVDETRDELSEKEKDVLNRLNTLVGGYRYWLTSVAMKQGCNFHDAEDLLHDTYLHLLPRIALVHIPSSTGAYVKTTIMNLARNAKSRNRMQFFTDLDYNDRDDHRDHPLMHKIAVPDDDVHIPLEQLETRELLETMIPLLDPISKETLRDFYLEGLHLSDISDLRGVPIGTVKRRLHTGRKRLRLLMEEKGFESADLLS